MADFVTFRDKVGSVELKDLLWLRWDSGEGEEKTAMARAAVIFRPSMPELPSLLELLQHPFDYLMTNGPDALIQFGIEGSHGSYLLYMRTTERELDRPVQHREDLQSYPVEHSALEDRQFLTDALRAGLRSWARGFQS